MRRTFGAPLRPRACLVFALAASMVAAMLVWLPAYVADTEVGLLRPAADGPSQAVFARDFPDYALMDGVGHDGQQFYAIAQDPFDLDETAQLVDPPRYRLQRILFPLLARGLHPESDGLGLVRSLVLVNLLGMALLGLCVGLLSTSLGGRPVVAAVPPLLAGSLFGLGLGTPDALAAGLALLAVVLSLRGRHRWAVVAGVLAVLTREVHVVVLIGWALWRRDRSGLWLAAVPVAVAAAWAGALRILVPASAGSDGFALFGAGWATAVQRWADGSDLLGLTQVVVAVLLLAVAFQRHGAATPLTGVLALQVLLLAPLHADVVALEGNLSRALLPLMCVTLALVTVPSGRLAQDSPALGSRHA